MSILVTGGAGFIGHHVVKLLQGSHPVLIIDKFASYGELTYSQKQWLVNNRTHFFDPAVLSIDIATRAVLPAINHLSPEIIIHLASHPRAKTVEANLCDGTSTMMTGLVHCLSAAKTSGTKRFVYVSSSMVYGDFDDGVLESAPCSPKGYYATLKYAGEQLVKDFCTKHNIDYIIVRPSAVYGPGDTLDRVIPTFFQRANQGGELKVCGENEKLDFSYVEDIAYGIVQAALANASANKTYNLTNGNSRTILDAAQQVKKIMGSGNIYIAEKSELHPSRGSLSIANAKKDFNFNPTTSLEEGLERYFYWFRKSIFYK